MRSAGILLHITSLPSRFGIGTMGKEAFNFIDFLKRSHQSSWQILPVNPTGFGNSPYQSPCAFAGNTLLIDLEELLSEGLLTNGDFEGEFFGEDEEKVDFDAVNISKNHLLKKAFSRFSPDSSYFAFESENAHWLNDFALFSAIKEVFDDKPWYEWEDTSLRDRAPDSLRDFEYKNSDKIKFFKFCQYIFFRQWSKMHDYAKENGIEIIGDIPIYVSYDSSDVWTKRRLFKLNSDGFPTYVAGCPPDAFSESGQLWGNPLYDWDKMAEDGFGWWIERIKASLYLYDRIRIDHFRGFESYYAIPYGDTDAIGGHWEKGPGIDLFYAIKNRVPDAKIIAEDLGYLTDAVYHLLDMCGFPGMKVMQFAFDPYNDNPYLLHNHTKNSVVYTGTHDNDTTAGWYEGENNKEFIRDYLGVSTDNEVPEAMVRTCLKSPADLAIIPIQDYLQGGRRMNTPSTVNKDNWSFRIKKCDLNDILAHKIGHLTSLYKRSV